MAGAWLQKPGHGIAIAQLARSDSNRVVDAAGREFAQENYRQWVQSVYAEAGLTERVTIGGDANLIQSRQYVQSAQRDARGVAFTEPSLFARYGLIREGPQRVSLQGLVQFPRRRLVEEGLTLGNPEAEYELALQYGYGRSLTTPWGAWPAFVDAHLGYRLRAGRAEDQWKTFLTAGVTPVARWQVLMQAFGTWRVERDASPGNGFTQSNSDDYDQLRLQAGVVWSVTPEWSGQAALYRDVFGRNLGLAQGALVGVWRSF